MKLNSIQYLRAIAAGIVVVYHASNTLLGRENHLLNLDFGAFGVDMFFVVSGFIMFYTNYRAPLTPSTFFVRRLIRIFPLYFVLSTLMLVMVAASPASFNRESPNFGAYLASIFFIPHWNPRLHDLQPILGPGWTLNYEMFFYCLFALSLFIRHRLNGLAVLPVIIALVIVGRLYPGDGPAFLTYTSPLMIEFCLGVVVGAALSIPRDFQLRWLLAVLVISAVASSYLFLFRFELYGTDMARPFFIGLTCVAIVTAMVAIEYVGKLPRIAYLILAGDASYSLYLVHTFFLGAGQHLWHRVVSGDTLISHTLFIVLIYCLSMGTAVVVYRNLELKVGRRLSSALKSYQERSRAQRHERVEALK